MRFAAVTVLALALVTVAVPSARAAPPVVDYLYPAGGRQGTTVALGVGPAKGEAAIDGWPAVKVWSDRPGLSFEPGKKVGTFAVTIAADAEPGPRLVRVTTADGASVPRVFVVGRHVEQAEDEKAADGPQVVARLPAVLNGRLAKPGESDAWAVDVAEPGQWLVADLACRRLGSPVDAALQLVDPDGTVVAFDHDTFGLDPLLAHRVARPGRYTIHVAGFAHPPAADVRFAGSRAAVYRLSVTTGPYARHAIPGVAGRGRRTPVRLFGWNLPGGPDGAAAEVDAREAGDAETVTVTGVDLDNELRLPLSHLPGSAEVEPNDAVGAPADPLAIPAAVDGRLGRPGDVDRFAVAARKGDKLAAVVRARGLNSRLDAVVTVVGPDGSQVARGDDAGDDLDPRAEWTAAADGTYVVAVTDLKGGGGPYGVYRLEVSAPVPAFAATADAHSYRLEPGQSAAVKVAVVRTGEHAGPLTLSAADLPDGVSAECPVVPATGGPFTITLKAAADTKPASGPFRLRVSDGGNPAEGRSVERPVLFGLEPGGFVPAADVLWLTVGTGKPTSTTKTAEPK